MSHFNIKVWNIAWNLLCTRCPKRCTHFAMSYLRKYWIWCLHIFYSNSSQLEIVHWKIYEITSRHSRSTCIWKATNFQPCNNVLFLKFFFGFSVFWGQFLRWGHIIQTYQLQRKSSGHYIIGEEIKTTENRNYEFKAGGVLFHM